MVIRGQRRADAVLRPARDRLSRAAGCSTPDAALIGDTDARCATSTAPACPRELGRDAGTLTTRATLSRCRSRPGIVVVGFEVVVRAGARGHDRGAPCSGCSTR